VGVCFPFHVFPTHALLVRKQQRKCETGKKEPKSGFVPPIKNYYYLSHRFSFMFRFFLLLQFVFGFHRFFSSARQMSEK